MLFQIIEENGVKKIQALTADTGTGAPVGSYLYLEKKSNPQGYLYCDGSTFDETVYPALYQYLGTNVLPDWREFSAVGAEQNTTNVYNAQTNPNGVIHDHDVYTEGQAKDDQLQSHTHTVNAQSIGVSGSGTVMYGSEYSSAHTTNTTSGRTGTTTHGKRKAVFIYIKATSGLTENQQENVLNTINENNSYSTEEHPTGKKWIDGKPIYSRTFSATSIPSDYIIGQINNIDTVIQINGVIKNNDGNFLPINYAGIIYCNVHGNGNVSLNPSNYTALLYNIIVEYTKTTD